MRWSAVSCALGAAAGAAAAVEEVLGPQLLAHADHHRYRQHVESLHHPIVWSIFVADHDSSLVNMHS